MLLAAIMLGSAGTFLVLPFLALRLSDETGLGAGTIGLLIAVQVVTSRGLTVVTGPLSDAWGARRLLLASIVVIGASYAALAAPMGPWGYAVVLAVMGLGVAAFQPSSKSLLAAHASRGERGDLFARRNVAFNAGAAAGGAVGAVLVEHAAALFLAAGALYALLAVLVAAFVEADPGAGPGAGAGAATAGAAPPRPFAAFAAALRDRRLVAVIAVGAGFWYLYSQLNVTVPLAASDAGLRHLVGLMFTVNALLVIAAQIPLARLAERRGLAPAQQVALGGLLVGIALGGLAFLGAGLAVGLAFAVVFTTGEMLVAPNLDTLTSDLAPDDQVGTYFGVAYLGYAIGGTLGSVGGGLLLEAGRRGGAEWLPWGVAVAVGAAVWAGAPRLARPRAPVGAVA